MTPRRFLIIGGETLLFLGTLGYLGVFSRETTPLFWTSSAENLGRTLVGVIAVGAIILPRVNEAVAPYLRWIVVGIGAITLFLAVYGFLQVGRPEPNAFGVANLEHPLENLFHLILATWAFLAAFGGPRRDGRAEDADGSAEGR